MTVQPVKAAPPVAMFSAIGHWQGILSPTPGPPIPLVLHIAGTPGQLSATVDSPSQGTMGLAVDSVVQEGGVVQFKMAALKASFAGRLSSDGRTLSGQWTQVGVSLELTMQRMVTAGPTSTPKPQTPLPPFPYESEEVTFENPSGRSHLAGTLTLPSGPRPHPAVILITGSGLQDRNESMFGHQPFLVWADTLTRRGIAVLRVDDRQIGGSTGEVRTATTADFAGDVESGVAFLRSRRDIDHRRVGLMGHSEGAIIAAMVAARDSDIAFIVMLAGSGEPGQDLMLEQKRIIETLRGASPAMAGRLTDNMQHLYDAVREAPDQAAADAALQTAWRALASEDGQTVGSVPSALRPIASPWMRWFLRYDPRSALARVRCPALAIGGAKDIQVSADTNLAGIALALRSNRDATVVKLPGLNHLLQTADTGDPTEYENVQETVSPVALRTVGDWIISRTRHE